MVQQPPWGPPGQHPPAYPPPGPPGWEAEEERRRAHPHPVPRSYPLMLRTWDYAWWRPVVGIISLLLSIIFVVPLLLMPVLAVAVALQGGSGSFGDRFSASLALDSVTPASMLYLNLTLASLTLVAMLIVRFVHRLRPRWLASVAPGMRWKFFLACLGLAVVALLASLVVGAFLPRDPNQLDGSAHLPTGQLAVTAVIILLTTPLQALGEEYAFRGYLMQAFGSFVHGIAQAFDASERTARLVAQGLALVCTSGLFALAHGTQNFPLFFDRFTFGMMAGLVVILVGGLEAGIALHVLNNLLAFGLAIAYDQLDGVLTVSEATIWQLPVTIVQNGVFLLLVVWVARRMGLRSSTAPPGLETADRGEVTSAR